MCGAPGSSAEQAQRYWSYLSMFLQVVLDAADGNVVTDEWRLTLTHFCQHHAHRRITCVKQGSGFS